MQLSKIAFEDTRSFSSTFLDYINQKENLKPFYHRYPAIQNFEAQIDDKGKSFPEANRKVLVSVLEKQYEKLKVKDVVKHNINALKDKNTFTVTTGHQLNIFTGPLYFIYKIVTVINACKELKAKHPEYNFVPVYWMASEDHDYDEIKYFRLYGKKYTWETNQTGAVGRFNTKGFDSLLKEIPGDIKIFQEAYSKNKTLSEAVRYYVNEIFGAEGVVVVDADDRELKSLFTNVMHQDIIGCNTINLVNATNEKLEALNHKAQVFCRDINFFYLDNNLRSRIEKEGDIYKVLDTQLSFTEDAIKKLIQNEPEKFSPNVILRPLYQEVILPNLAYVGGPAEVVYWLQLKNVFDHFNIPFPMLMPRNFALVISHDVNRKMEKTGVDLKTFFEEKNFIFNDWIIKNTKHNLTVGKERETLNKLFEAVKEKASNVDQTLVAYVGAEGKRALNSLEKIEHKLLRAEKRLHSDKLRQIEAVKDSLFPNGNLQERTDNFLNFYQQDAEFVQKLINRFDPFDFKFNVLTYAPS